MNKKILIVLMAVFLLLPVTNSFAYTNGLLAGSMMTSHNFASGTVNSTTYAVTDNNLTTNSAIYETGHAQDALTGTLDTASSVSSVKLKANGSFTMKLYNSSLSEIGTYTVSGDQVEYILPVAKADVKKITLVNMTGTAVAIYEFDAFATIQDGGTPPVTIVHSPVTNVAETHTHDTANLSWTNPTGGEFTGTIIKKDGIEVANLANNISSFAISGLSPETTYNYEIFAKYSDSVNSSAVLIPVTTSVAPVDGSAPSNITNVMEEHTSTTVSFVYSLPVDTDFDYLDIYRDGVLIKANHTLSTFDDMSLIPNTSYVYKFVSVDALGNESTGYIQTVLTDSEIDGIAPDSPLNIVTTDGNSSGSVSWNVSPELDIRGYNVFVDGVKHNSTVILATNYVIPNLTNGTTYVITVSAVDTSGNESLKSLSDTITPTTSAMPIYEMEYDLKDVADGTASWFNSLWLILAFSVAIPLAFLVSRRIKDLFIG